MPTIRERVRRRNGKREIRWQVQVRLAGHGPITKTFDKFADAEAWGREQERKLKLGDTPTERRKELQAMTLNALIEAYYRDCEENLHKKKVSYDNEKVVLDAMLERDPKLAAKTLAELNRLDLQQYIDRRINSHILPSTVRRELNPLRHIYKFARRERELPVPDIFCDLNIPGDPPSRERRLLPDEFRALQEATINCRGKRQQRLWYSLVLAAYCTGLRRGELLKLQWADVELQAHTLLVRAENAKTKKRRLLPLEKGLCFHLMLYRSAIPEQDRSSSSRVFPISGTAHEQAWRRIVSRAKIANLHFHDLRHAAGTRYDELGLTRSENEYMLGHKGSGTNSRYVHADIERIRAKLDAGYEHMELPKDDDEVTARADGMDCIPDELDGLMTSWKEKDDLNKLTQTEKAMLAKAYFQRPEFRYFFLKHCTNGAVDLADEATVGKFDAFMLALRPLPGVIAAG